MSRKLRRKQEWWESARFWRRAGIVVVVLAFVALGGLVIFAGGGGGGHPMPSTALNEPAPAFQLPTITGGETSLQEHLGKHNVLLYFNEGMG